MSEKTKKFEEQLNALIRKGDLLTLAIEYDCHTARMTQVIEKKLGKEEAKKYLDNIPSFRDEYQSWYSESLATIKQILPDRIDDFSSYYQYPRVRKDITYENYMIRDYLQGLEVKRGDRVIAGKSAAIPEFDQQLNIVKAAKELLDSTLIDLTSILQADLFDSEIESARGLAKAGFRRAAGAMCGVVIEKHLGHVCDRHGINIRKKRPTISDFYDKLKAENIIDIPQWRLIQRLGDIRNICDHAGEREPSAEEVDDLISGTDKVLKTIF